MGRRAGFSALFLLAACADGSDRASHESAAISPDVGAFTDVTRAALPTQLCTGSERGCYTNYAITADLDGDGNLDLVMANGGGHFVPQAPEPQGVYFGDARGHFVQAFETPVSLVRQVAVADFDGDGRLDLYFPGGYGGAQDQLWFQRAPRRFENDPGKIGALSSRAGAVHAGDVDGDGDLDIVIADWGSHPNPDSSTPASAVTLRLYVNDGTGSFTAGATLPAPEGSSATDVDLTDIDGDFALDIVLTNRNGQSRLYSNDGNGHFTDVTHAWSMPPKKGPFSFNAEPCDFDKDGDLDLLFDSAGASLPGHTSQVLVNDGKGHFSDETTARIGGEPRSDDNQLKCADVDNDGDYDLVVASLSNSSEKLLRNDGTAHFTNAAGVFPRVTDPTLAIDLGDFDHDGKIDLFTANGEVPNASWLERIYSNGAARADANAPTFRAIEHPTLQAGKPTVLRLAVLDSHTSEVGQHVQSVTLDVTADGVKSTVPAKFVGGDVFRAVVPAAVHVTVTPRATDPAGNVATGAAFSL